MTSPFVMKFENNVAIRFESFMHLSLTCSKRFEFSVRLNCFVTGRRWPALQIALSDMCTYRNTRSCWSGNHCYTPYVPSLTISRWILSRRSIASHTVLASGIQTAHSGAPVPSHGSENISLLQCIQSFRRVLPPSTIQIRMQLYDCNDMVSINRCSSERWG